MSDFLRACYQEFSWDYVFLISSASKQSNHHKIKGTEKWYPDRKKLCVGVHEVCAGHHCRLRFHATLSIASNPVF